MLYFVIPLRSAQTTRNWHAIQSLLQRTLNSVDNQICGSFKCLVICHEKPDEIELPQSCELLEAPFAPPKVNLADLGSEIALFEMHSDKGRKLIFGLSEVRKMENSFVMFLDADDFVSNQLSELVQKNPESNGWYFDHGYRWNHQTPRFLFPRNNFFHECGSSYILRSEVAPFPDHLDLTKDLDDYFIRRYVFHAYVRDAMQKLGFPLEPLPLYGAVYTFNAHNFYARQFRRKDSSIREAARILLKGKRITQDLRDEFCMP